VSISPASLTRNAGETAEFTVDTTLSPPLSFQWFHNGVAVPGAAAESLIITNIQASDAGNYSLEVSQPDPPMIVFTTPANLIGPVALQRDPQFISTRPSSNVSFQVVFTGASPIQLQWHHDQRLIPDATNAMLTLTNVQLADQGDYSVTASNSFGVLQSLRGTLVILITPVLATHPVRQSVAAGGSVTL